MFQEGKPVPEYRPTRWGWAFLLTQLALWAVNLVHAFATPSRTAAFGGPWWFGLVVLLANIAFILAFWRARLDTAAYFVALLWYVALVGPRILGGA